MVAAMARLGFDRFAVAGHDRGGRVAYRLALDHPRRVDRIAVLDVSRPQKRGAGRRAFRLAFWPWAIPGPACTAARAPAGRGAGRGDRRRARRLGLSAGVFDDGVRAAYVAALRDPDVCTRSARNTGPPRRSTARTTRPTSPRGRRITCPLLALWSAQVRSERGMRRRATADRPSNRSCHDPGCGLAPDAQMRVLAAKHLPFRKSSPTGH